MPNLTLPPVLTLAALQAAYAAGATPLEVVEVVLARRAALADPAVFITKTPDDDLRAQARMLVDQAISHLGSFGPEADLLRAIARYSIERDR